jgi:aminoglycoside 6'-N-acetyltransferase
VTFRLDTARLVVRAFEIRDVDALHAYRNDPQTARFQSWTSPYPFEQARAAVTEMRGVDRLRVGDWTQLAVERRDAAGLIGDIGVRLSDDAREAEVGYTFAPAARGQGYASEAVAAVVEHLFDRVGVRRVEARADPDNGRSRRLLERIGFTYVGTAEGDGGGDQEGSDEAHYEKVAL